ncbi:MAG: putative sugar phosphatases of the HAD superfamily [Rhodobacteraceae bacterium HLUCCA08]|nr:MAG: putative sugar phosphatases of the HAD superfamily [Rhodobacteraceae bacterium HLUCCA08]
MPRLIDSFAEIGADYDLAYVDLWGCVHDGIVAFAPAIAALQAFRAQNGKVILVTNSPRPRRDVVDQITAMGIPDDAWDDIATSGDSARAAMFRGAVGSDVFFIGEERDLSFFDPLALIDTPVPIARVPLERAEGIVCTGPFDAHADPDDLRPQLLYAKQTGLKLLCANPDIVVDRGARREYCAGAVAQLYTEMGGESLYFGKPHPPIYDLARRRYAALPGSLRDPRIIAIGDGIRTDILGAQQEDIDSLFITGGLAATETRTTPQGPEPQALNAYLQAQMVTPTFAMAAFR